MGKKTIGDGSNSGFAVRTVCETVEQAAAVHHGSLGKVLLELFWWNIRPFRLEYPM